MEECHLNINEIIEKLSEQVHNTWMENRIQEGWSYGPKRNDLLKQTPCIVPYEELPLMDYIILVFQ